MLRIDLAFLVGHRDIQGGNRGSSVPWRPEGVEGLKAGLAILLGERGLEARVHVTHDRRAGAEVGGDGQHGVRVPGAKRFARPDISRDVRPAEPVDCLFGIADQEQRARPGRKFRPFAGIAVSRRLAAEAPEYLRLKRVGVLELVDEDMPEARGQSTPHLVVVAQEIARREYQIVEVQQRGGALVLAEQLHDGPDQRHETGEHTSRYGLVKRRPGRAAKGVMSAGRVVQPLRIGLGQASALCGGSPLPLFLILPEAAGPCEEFGIGRHHQQRDERGRRIGRERGGDLPGQFSKLPRDDGGFRFLPLCLVHERAEFVHHLPELGSEQIEVL